jgi:hypothetical protein
VEGASTSEVQWELLFFRGDQRQSRRGDVFFSLLQTLLMCSRFVIGDFLRISLGVESLVVHRELCSFCTYNSTLYEIMVV